MDCWHVLTNLWWPDQWQAVFRGPVAPGLLLCQPPGLPKAQTGTASPTLLVWENLIHLRVSNSVCRRQHKGGPPVQPSPLNISPDPRSYLCVHLSYASPRALPQTSPLAGLGPPSVPRLCARVGCTHIEYQCSEMGPENIWMIIKFQNEIQCPLNQYVYFNPSPLSHPPHFHARRSGAIFETSPAPPPVRGIYWLSGTGHPEPLTPLSPLMLSLCVHRDLRVWIAESTC